MGEVAIETRGLAKRFRGGVVAVDGLDMEVERGSVYGLIGRNGAGKTTTLRLLMGLLRANGGCARVLGMDMWAASAAERARVTYVSQELRLHDWMTLDELCRLCSFFYAAWDDAYAKRLANTFGLARDRQAGVMSGGERRKVAMLLALAARPEVLILDEPAANFDPIARRALMAELAGVLADDGDCTVLLSTHMLSDVERIADRVGIMDRGKLVTSARLDELQGTTRRVQVVFEGDAPPPDFAIPGAVRSEISGPVVTAVVRVASESELDELRRMRGARVQVFPLGLEDIFIELFGIETPQNPGEGVDNGHGPGE